MARINERQLRDYWDQGMPVSDIAELFSVHVPAVYAAAKRFDLPKRHLPNPGRVGRRVWTAAPPVEAPETEFDVVMRKLARARSRGQIVCPPGWDLESDIQVRMTNGQNAALRELAAQMGIAFARVLARWHVVRVV